MKKSKQSFRLANITAPEMSRLAALNPVILLPLGSHEDHATHLPMGDYVLADILAEQIAAAATNRGVPTFVAPCLPFGVADYFGSSPGGLALSPASFRAVLQELINALTKQGLRRILILNGHGGNAPVIHEVTLQIRHNDNLVIPSLYLWRIARELMAERLGPGSEGRFGHGAEPLLSLSMAMRAEDIGQRTEPTRAPAKLLDLPVSGFGTLAFLGHEIEAPVEFDQLARDAVTTSWPLASAEIGAEIRDALVDLAAKFVVYFANAASISCVSKSCSTASESTATSTMNSM